MSISSSGVRKAGPFIGDGSTTSFPFSFKVFQASDVLVVQTDTAPTDYILALNTHYTVSLNANQDANPGGAVNMVSAPPAGYLLTIGSQVPQIQTVTLTNNGGFYPTVINTALDYGTILIQQLSEKIGRALVMPFSTNASGQLPPVAPGQLLGWKADGSGIANVGASGVGAGSIVASNMAAGAAGMALSADTQAAATKATPADADELPLFDSASFWYLRRFTWANLKAALAGFIGTLLNMTGAINEARTTVASATTPDIWTGTGNIINYTGTAIATGFAAAPQAGARRVLDCAGAASFTASSSMVVDGYASGTTITVSAGDRVDVCARSTTTFVLRWIKASGIPIMEAAAVVASARNAKMSIPAASASGTLTADEVVVKSALGGLASVLGNYSQTVNLAATGAGGMDTGTAPASGFVSIYAIAKAGGGSPSILACNVATSSGSVYSGANMPAGYTLSALLGIVPTNASGQMVGGFVLDRKFHYQSFPAIYTGHADQSALTSQSISAQVPPAARTASFWAATTLSTTGMGAYIAADSIGTGAKGMDPTGALGASRTFGGMAATLYGKQYVSDVLIITVQTIYIWQTGGNANNLYVSDYTW